MAENTNRRRLGDRAAAEYPAGGQDVTTTLAPTTDDLAAILAHVDREADNWWRCCALAGIQHLAALGTPFTCYDLVALGVPEPDHPNRWGALFNIAARAEIIRCVGIVTSTRPTTHRALVRLWIGAEHEAQEAA